MMGAQVKCEVAPQRVVRSNLAEMMRVKVDAEAIAAMRAPQKKLPKIDWDHIHEEILWEFRRFRSPV